MRTLSNKSTIKIKQTATGKTSGLMSSNLSGEIRGEQGIITSFGIRQYNLEVREGRNAA